jgi:DNA-binding transcriptional MerR regulator
MPSTLSKDKKFVPIGKAVQILGVSIDTVRRWDKAGILHSVRHDGKNRYFSVDELKSVKSSKPFSISDAAHHLGISTTTLRRLDKRGILQPQRNQHGVRFYTHEDIDNHINSEHFVPKKIISEKPIKTSLLSAKESIDQLPQALITDRKNLANAVKETKEQVSEAEEEIQETEEKVAETQKQVTHLQHLHNIFNSSSAAVLATVAVVIVGISLSFLLLPEDTANFFGYERKPVQALSNQVLGARYPTDQETDQGNLVGRVLKPISRI